MSDNLHEMSLRELELRIMLANAALCWLRSDDPMLKTEQYRGLVQPALERVSDEWYMLIEARNEKLNTQAQPAPVVVGLKSAKVNTKVGGF